MPDDIDGQIDGLLSAWARAEQVRLERVAEAQRAHLEMRRKTLLAGEWVPGCVCRLCLRAILTMAPEIRCDSKASGQWWIR